MKLSKYILGGIVVAMSFAGASCVDDLNVTPDDPNIKTEPTEKSDIDGYLASVYYDLYTDGGLSLSDGGRGVFTRCHGDLNEITADELFISEKWQDPGYQVLNKNTWSDTNEWIYAAFSRENHLAKIASTFIAVLHQYGPQWYTAEEISAMDAEARVLRGYAYYQNIDLFGRGPWIDENSPTGATPPTYDRKQLFEAVVADLSANVDNLIPAAQQTYGRISREAGYMLLAKLYLNAEVYTGTAMYKECAEALKNVVNTGITLAPEYKYLFCASNDKYVGGNGEIIWGLPQDRNHLTTWGGTTELTCASYMEADTVDSNLSRQLLALDFPGTPWSGLRVRPELSKALEKETKRNLLYRGDYQMEIPDLVSYKENSCGYMLIKYSFATEDNYGNPAAVAKFDQVKEFNNNLQHIKGLPADVKAALTAAVNKAFTDENDGHLYNLPAIDKAKLMEAFNKAVADDKDLKKEDAEKMLMAFPTASSTDQMSGVDYPVFRLADAYLMLAECQMRGVECNGFYYFNEVRKRAGMPTIANPSASDILHERQCELYAEGYRRSDLIRFNRYTGSNYLWSWKGGEYTGAPIDATRALFPIPYQYVITVGQNPGY